MCRASNWCLTDTNKLQLFYLSQLMYNTYIVYVMKWFIWSLATSYLVLQFRDKCISVNRKA